MTAQKRKIKETAIEEDGHSHIGSSLENDDDIEYNPSNDGCCSENDDEDFEENCCSDDEEEQDAWEERRQEELERFLDRQAALHGEDLNLKECETYEQWIRRISRFEDEMTEEYENTLNNGGFDFIKKM